MSYYPSTSTWEGDTAASSYDTESFSLVPHSANSCTDMIPFQQVDPHQVGSFSEGTREEGHFRQDSQIRERSVQESEEKGEPDHDSGEKGDPGVAEGAGSERSIVLYEEPQDYHPSEPSTKQEDGSRWTFLQGLTYGVVASSLMGDALPQAMRSLSQLGLARATETIASLLGYSDYEFQWSGRKYSASDALQSVLMRSVIAEEREKLQRKEQRLSETRKPSMIASFFKRRGSESKGSSGSSGGAKSEMGSSSEGYCGHSCMPRMVGC
jgi:hypothetical protein